MAFCPNCGAQANAGKQFCTNCGAKIASEQSPQPQNDVQQPQYQQPQFQPQPQPQYQPQPQPQFQPQPQYQQPQYPPQPQFRPLRPLPKDNGDVFAGIGLVLGLIAPVFLVIGWEIDGIFFFLSLPAAIVGLVLSCKGKTRLKAHGRGTGLAVAGIVIGIIAVIITSIAFLILLWALAMAGTVSIYNDWLDDTINEWQAWVG